MPYNIRLSKSARKFYRSASPSSANKIARCLAILEDTPRQHPNIKKLTGKLNGRYRYRIGDYRVVYKINEDVVEVGILLIKHRSDAYE